MTERDIPRLLVQSLVIERATVRDSAVPTYPVSIGSDGSEAHSESEPS